ncbi:MAG: SUKH-3 domain-containing protein [Lachnospiraceae bacterium]|nr:SUKH-3 domain-containing protein [Lachnospiraceae bacterium]
MEEVKNILRKAGYFKERSVDISEIVDMYEECGYHYDINQIAFIEKYAYLEISYIHPIWKQEILLRINPIEAQKVIAMDIVEEYNKFLQDELLIVGEIEGENLTLFLSKKGIYFTGYDDCIINWGDNFEIMLKKIISGERGELRIMD